MKDCFPVLGCRAEQDVLRFFKHCFFGKPEQPAADSLGSVSRLHIQLFHFKERHPIRHNRGRVFCLLDMAKQITDNISLILRDKDTVSFDIGSLIFAISVAALLRFPIFRQMDQYLQQFWREFFLCIMNPFFFRHQIHMPFSCFSHLRDRHVLGRPLMFEAKLFLYAL